MGRDGGITMNFCNTRRRRGEDEGVEGRDGPLAASPVTREEDEEEEEEEEEEGGAVNEGEGSSDKGD